MNAIALQEPVSKLKGSVIDCTLLGKTFIWLPFVGGISAFAVILPKPMGTGHGVGGGYPEGSRLPAVEVALHPALPHSTPRLLR
jgi:hypothetical protein